MELLINQKFDTKIYLVEKDSPLSMLSDELKTYLKESIKFTGKLNEKYAYMGPKTDQIILVGLGDGKELRSHQYIYAANTASKILNEYKIKEASLAFEVSESIEEADALQAVAEGFLQSRYQFDRYLGEKPEVSLEKISFTTELKDAEELLTEREAVIDAVDFTRELVNTPANDLYPAIFADKVVNLFKDSAVDVKIYDKEALEELGAASLLAVSKAAIKEPRLVVMKYLPLGEEVEAISLVGKGVTYDSGGYAIKSAGGMKTMMTDMAGAGATVGALQAIVKNKIQQNVIAIIGLTENMIAGDAMKNGDIISSLKGTTIEVVNTDAEGRLVLADALYYAASQVKSKAIVDVATLTGAVIAALGMNTTGAMTNNEPLYKDLETAAAKADEKIWELPIDGDDHERIKGKKADLVNGATDNAGAGTIYAAAFLEHFVEDIPWVHLDIAGTSYKENKGFKYRPRGASGIPVKTLYEFVKKSVD